MSERMIELARAKMGLAPLTSTQSKEHVAITVATNGNGANGELSASSSTASLGTELSQGNPPDIAGEPSAAASVVMDEDASLDLFLSLLADPPSLSLPHIDDNRNPAENDTCDGDDRAASMSPQSSFTTVPPALSRRILNRQGVGFFDDNVATITSIAADKFLSTVLAQAIVCRDRRVKGEDVRKRERREWKRYRKLRRTERLEMRRLKGENEEKIKLANARLIEANKALCQFQTGGTAAVAHQLKGKAKKSKKETAATIANALVSAHNEVIELSAPSTSKDKDKEMNGSPGKSDNGDYTGKGNAAKSNSASLQLNKRDFSDYSVSDDDDVDYSSESSEEEDEENEEDEERRYVLHLRDVVRPLEAWGVSLAGKKGLCPEPPPDGDRDVDGPKRDQPDGDEHEMQPGDGNDGNDMEIGTSVAPFASTEEDRKSPQKKTKKRKADDSTSHKDLLK